MSMVDDALPVRAPPVPVLPPSLIDVALPEGPGLGIDLDVEECARHPYRKNAFPSLWNAQWLKEFTKAQTT